MEYFYDSTIVRKMIFLAYWPHVRVQICDRKLLNWRWVCFFGLHVMQSVSVRGDCTDIRDWHRFVETPIPPIRPSVLVPGWECTGTVVRFPRFFLPLVSNYSMMWLLLTVRIWLLLTVRHSTVLWCAMFCAVVPVSWHPIPFVMTTSWQLDDINLSHNTQCTLRTAHDRQLLCRFFMCRVGISSARSHKKPD
jgi:hypothetical protein